ncbi:SDR family oxidoreductase [Pilimelia columellifera]|uniref:SDR family oxidoreductase n=1 Tax=Pilimelia columellifera subsp. columellifera TaxID=706583 RepID=A0ABN3NCQ0_9ACTN
MSNVVVITGAARGIGRATALLAARRGYRVCVNYRDNAAAAARTVTAIEDDGGAAIAVPADVGDPVAVARMFDTVDRELGPVTALVNNAGVLATQCRVEQITVDRLTEVLRVNVIGPFLCAQQAVRRMSTARGGSGGAIVNVSSAAARLGSPNEYVDYAASKGALDTFTTGLSLEVAGEGIRVNAVRPGIIETDIHASGGDAGRAARLGPSLPLGRAGRPVEVANAIVFLLSAEAAFITGSFVDVAGGR